MITYETWTQRNRKEYYGLSTDDKPTDCVNGSTLYLMDTNKKLYFVEPWGWMDYSAKKVTSIAIATAPTKVSYVEGQEFDPTGIAVTVTYSDSTTASKGASDCTYNKTVLTIDDNKVVVRYTENGTTATAEQSITVVAKAPSSLAWTTAPTKVAYTEGEVLELAGAKVTCTYNDSSTKDVTILCEYDPEDGDELTTDDDKVTATYTEGETEVTSDQSITVTAEE